ncbi:ATP-dependent helicase [Candidatus Roizmanbacteria bacterium CG_4_10_14_0_8_um_filter_39_9]|uniref:ATP-dependent helicase n=1 Tax=Candidatus Roizmanbacteria bacterium CG_4_10_14_0_8_um_filter_39_9 TaxID=1974829 RepID=A0A2M7QBJ5_9BACT|nr:MAG: ATP-dependent helicase [Candidatus Roizmanbacteria bacterium CG_4_10_14_0_8_um_filter_39_9]
MFNRNHGFQARTTGGFGGHRPSGGYGRFGGFRGGRSGGGRGRGPATSGSAHAYIQRATMIQAVKTVEAKPSVSVNTLPINIKLMKNIVARGYEYLMPIQEKGIGPILEGKDVIGIANTGTGKTAAFLIPIVEKVMKDPNYRALVITPTRELALQIQEDLRTFTRGIPVYSTFCIGQSSMRNQIYELRRNPHVVIGTPGRLKDLIARRMLRLESFSMIVLDEVDQMLDMGFVQDVKHIISFLPAKRQSLFFSATLSPEINTIIKSFVVNPITISVKKTETTSHIKQEVVRTMGKLKIDVLNDLLKQEEFKKVLIFGRTKMGVERLSRDLFQKGFKVTSIHGDKPQIKRQQAIRMFKDDVVSVMVATDVAARGLDIHDVTHVINFDIPQTYEDYIHRIGRTGRADKMGTALTFVE